MFEILKHLLHLKAHQAWCFYKNCCSRSILSLPRVELFSNLLSKGNINKAFACEDVPGHEG